MSIKYLLTAALAALSLLVTPVLAQIPLGPVPGGAQMPPVFGMPPYTTGGSVVYQNPLTIFNLTASGPAGAANSYYCVPYWITQTVTIKALGIGISSTSTGNTSAALQGAIYNNAVTTGGGGINNNRPSTLVDYTANFATGSTGFALAAMNNTTDTLIGPALYWGCIQKFDATAKFTGAGVTTSSLGMAIIGSTSTTTVFTASTVSGISTTGTGYGNTNWTTFSSSLNWSEILNAPLMAIQVN